LIKKVIASGRENTYPEYRLGELMDPGIIPDRSGKDAIFLLIP